MLEHAREDRFCELVHVFDDEAVAVWAPCDHRLEGRVLQHPDAESEEITI